MKKRATALLLILLMVISLVSVMGTGALAAEKTVDITPASSNSPKESIDIDVGDTLIINVKNSSTSNAYSFTATLSKSGIAEIQNESTGSIAAGATGQITVNGLADGTVNIVIQNNGQYSNRKGTIQLTVGNGDPELPQADKTVGITPTTSNPDESISIDVGETLGINVTNSSSNSDYDYSATPSSSGIVRFLSDTTISIEKNSIGQFLVEGLANGKVDIAITNGNTQSERKGVIHLTVGNGGSEEPPTPGEDKTYLLTTTLEDGKNYLIVSSNTAGSTFILDHDGTTVKTTGAVISETNGVQSISSNISTAVFTSAAITNGFSLKNGDYYVTVEGSGTLTFNASSSTKYWNYSENKLSNGSSSATRYLTFDGGEFKGYYSQSNPNPSNIYLFVEDDGTEPPTVAVTDVSLDRTELTLEAGETASLKAAVSPSNATNKTVSWSSSDTDIATVDNGTVTAVAEGTATITVTTEDGNKMATCAVTVTKATEKPTYQLVDSLKDGGEYLIVSSNTEGTAYAMTNPGGTSDGTNMGRTEVTILADKTIKTGAKDIVWTATANGDGFDITNGTDYLEGKSGNVKIFKPQQYPNRFWTYDNSKLLQDGGNNKYTVYYSGSAFTQATSADATDNEVYIYEKVTSSTDPVAVTGVELDKETMALTVGGTGTLTANVAPDDATNKNVTWSSSDTAVATVDNSGKVTAVAVGTATITVTTEDGNKTATCDVTVTAPQEIESSVIELMKLKNNSSVWLIQIEAEAGKGFTYKGTAMVWSSRYEAYVIAVEGATKPEPVAADFAAAGDAAAAVEYPAANDANGSKKVDMADVQYIYNLYSGKYETLEAAGDMTKVLGADINGDGVIDSKDATPILTALRGAQA